MSADPGLLGELAPAAEALLERHLASAKPWYPHELVPWSRGRDMADGQPQWRYDGGAAPLPAGVRSALIVNLLTEDGLPFYLAGLLDSFGEDHPWGAWVRRWTAEEGRHAIVIRDYLAVTRSVDLRALEQARMAHIQHAPVPSAATPAEAFVYVALQELATRIAHRNTGLLLGDAAGDRIMAQVAVDENLHHLFYRDLVTAALARDPSGTVMAIDAQIRHFSMPGATIPGFDAHAAAIAEAGIYSAAALHEQVLVPLVVRHWDLGHLEGLSPAAERARERVLRFIDRFGRIAGRLTGDS
jgi:acyl-[acyl-carrier-protein] desaturase